MFCLEKLGGPCPCREYNVGMLKVDDAQKQGAYGIRGGNGKEAPQPYQQRKLDENREKGAQGIHSFFFIEFKCSAGLFRLIGDALLDFFEFGLQLGKFLLGLDASCIQRIQKKPREKRKKDYRDPVIMQWGDGIQEQKGRSKRLIDREIK